MLIDPVTVAAAAPTPQLKFAIVRSDAYGSERIDTNGGGYSTIINHSKSSKGNRHYAQMTLGKDATDPYSGLTRRQVASVSATINRPAFGFTDAEMIALVLALMGFINSADVTPARLLQFQS